MINLSGNWFSGGISLSDTVLYSFEVRTNLDYKISFFSCLYFDKLISIL